MVVSLPVAPLLRASLLDAPGAAHGFATREGGVSRGRLGPLNLGRRPGEEDAALVENWARAARGLDPRLGAGDVAIVEQVHGAAVLRVDAPGGPLRPLGKADALVTTRRGVVLAARAADCAPVLLVALGPDGRAAGVAAAHAGWRGAAAGVAPAALAALCAATGRGPGDVRAAVGPCIGPGAFEVGPEVVDALVAYGLDRSEVVADATGPRPRVDLAGAIAAQLRRAGLERVELLRRCTATDPAFHSHRRDPEGGRGAGLIALV